MTDPPTASVAGVNLHLVELVAGQPPRLSMGDTGHYLKQN
jgi:hypothetical protein